MSNRSNRMKETVKKIRLLLDELESKPASEEPSFKETFQLFELPELVASIVDHLQPALLPYEAAIYWYLFRHSIIATGDVFVRVSTRGLRDGVIKSFRARAGSPREDSSLWHCSRHACRSCYKGRDLSRR